MGEQGWGDRAAWEGELFRLLVENVRDYAIFIVDPDGLVRSWSRGAEHLLGYREDEVIGRSVDLFFTPEDVRAGVPGQEMRAARESGRGEDDRWHLRKGGGRFWVSGVMTPLWDEGGKLRGFAKIMRDRTEWRVAERHRQEGEALKTAILEAALDCIITIDHEGRVIEFNPAAEATFGYARGDVLGLELCELIIPPSLRDAHRKGLAHFHATGEGPVLGRRIELPAMRADGSEFLVELAITRIPTGGPPLFTAYLRDISERKRADDERERLLGQLEAERRHLETVIESSQDCIKELDLEGRLVAMSGTGQRLLEIRDLCDVLDKPWVDFWAGEDREAARGALAKAVAGGIGSFEGYCPTASGQPRWWDVMVTPIRDAWGRPERLLSVSRDITERRRHADERERLLAEAQEASRAKSQFLAVLSHELRTPLNPILLAVSSMIDRAGPPEDVRPAMEMIRHNVNLQARLIDDLLDTMRIVQGKMPLHWGVTDCHEVIRHAVQVCQSEVFGKTIRLDLDLAAGDHHVNADSARLQQVFWNLIKNAVKFSPEGGTITLRTRDEGDPGGPGGRLVVEVSDTGIGIEPDALPHIFDPFQQGETNITRRFGGLGLGLAICKGVIDAHEGTIVARSEGKGRGTTFEIALASLPTREIEEGQGRRRGLDPARPPASPPASTRKILVVEDEEATRRLMARLLRGLGHDVATSGTIAGGIEAAEDGGFDLIISDIGLPDGSGLDLIRRIIAAQGPTPSIALTGYGMEEDIVRSREAGFTAHMTKPIDFTRLEAMIRQVAG